MPISGVWHERNPCNNWFVACATMVTHCVIVQFCARASLMEFDFSDLPPDFLEDIFSREVVSKSILYRVEARAKTMDWKNIPEDQCILLPKLFSWIIDEEDVHPSKRAKVEEMEECRPLKEVANRFGGSVTDAGTLATFSKGFVPDTTKQNTQWALGA